MRISNEHHREDALGPLFATVSLPLDFDTLQGLQKLDKIEVLEQIPKLPKRPNTQIPDKLKKWGRPGIGLVTS